MNALRKIVLVAPVLLQTGLFATSLSAQNNSVDFEYDARGRLIQMTNNTGQEVLYTLDDAGNRTAAVIDLSPAAVASLVVPQTQSQTVSQPAKLPLSQDTSPEPEGKSGGKEDE